MKRSRKGRVKKRSRQYFDVAADVYCCDDIVAVEMMVIFMPMLSVI